jgi:hypothetical protein
MQNQTHTHTHTHLENVLLYIQQSKIINFIEKSMVFKVLELFPEAALKPEWPENKHLILF